MFKSKEANITNAISKLANSINLNLPDERMEQIDSKLDSILHLMKYEEYVHFIKSDEKLKLYDELLGKYANNDTVSQVLVKGFNDEMYKHLNKVIDDKIKELILK